MADLANRRIPVRTLNWLAPATAVCVAWRISTNLRDAVAELLHGRVNSKTALGLHLALDLLIVVVLLTRGLDRWARRRDDRQPGSWAGSSPPCSRHRRRGPARSASATARPTTCSCSAR